MNKGNCILGEILIMIIQQIYNNNVVLVLDENIKKELILTGCGIGFQKKKGQEIDKSKIERTFVIQDESFYYEKHNKNLIIR